MNETLCRALLRAGLTEEDVAARLQVDPKTVRRWLEGRVPYLRHRWAIAAMLGVDETDLWPQLRTTRTRPDEVLAIYPHRDTVPRDVWLRLIGAARNEIGILDDADPPVAADEVIMTAISGRAAAGVKVRVCLHYPGMPVAGQGTVRPTGDDTSVAGLREALAIYAPLRDQGEVEIRLHQGIVYSSVYYADDQLLVSQHAYGVPARSAPVLHLQHAENGGMAAAYLEAFHRAWTAARIC